MTIHEASRTLLKSPPELWAECSDATSLSRHLDQFGEIRITRLEPETAVAWEGENVSGTVKLEPSGWGTRVILTAEEVDPVIEGAPPALEAVAAPAPESVAAAPESVAGPTEPEPDPALAGPEAAPHPELAAPDANAESEPQPHADQAQAQPEPEPKMGFFARLFGRKHKLTWPQVEPVSETRAPEPEPVVAEETGAASEPEPGVAEETGAASESTGSEPEPELDPAEPEPAEPAAQAPQPAPDATIRALTDALESLGMAHHRPFSRS